MSQANTPVPVVESPVSEKPTASQTTTSAPQANTPVPVADVPASEKPTASQATTTALQTNTTLSQANYAASQTSTTESQSIASTPPVILNGTLTPTQSLTPTTAPQISVIPASSNGTVSIPPQEEDWRVGLCDADDMETCVRCQTPIPPVIDQFVLANARPKVRRMVHPLVPLRPNQKPPRQLPPRGSRI